MKAEDARPARSPTAADGHRLFHVPLHRVRRGRSTALATEAPPASPPHPKQPCRATLTLALAHELQGLIDAGEVADRATLARQLGFTRARVTQILDLMLLAPDIHEQLLSPDIEVRTGPIGERQLRVIAREPDWTVQRGLWRERLGERGR